MTPNETTVEAVAKAIYEALPPYPDYTWGDSNPIERTTARKQAKAALAAIPEPACEHGIEISALCAYAETCANEHQFSKPATATRVEELLYEHRTARERSTDDGLELVCVCGDVLWTHDKGFTAGELPHRNGMQIKDVAILHHAGEALARLLALPEPATGGGVTWKCDFCGYSNEDGDGKFARCSICGSEDFTKVDAPAPSTVGTVEELEALPPRTIVRDADGDEWLLTPARLAGDQRVFLLAIGTGNSYRAERVALPATILTPATTRDVGAEAQPSRKQIEADTLYEVANLMEQKVMNVREFGDRGFPYRNGADHVVRLLRALDVPLRAASAKGEEK